MPGDHLKVHVPREDDAPAKTHPGPGAVNAAVVHAESLTKRFGSVVAVDDLSFELERGTITGFLGPNGAGKTTTLRMLLGLAEPTSGRALVFGHRMRSSWTRPAASARCSKRPTSIPAAPAATTSACSPRRSASRASRVDEVLRLVELQGAAKRRVKGYSLGMRQRLGLAAALLGDPELLILDEPANGLDPGGVRWLRDFLRDFAAGQRTVLISSHVLAEVAQTVDQVLIINHGKLVVESSLGDLTTHAAGSVRVRTPETARLGDALRRAGIQSSAGNDHLLVAHGTTSDRVGDVAFAAERADSPTNR